MSDFKLTSDATFSMNLGKKEKPGMTGFEVFADIKIINHLDGTEAE